LAMTVPPFKDYCYLYYRQLTARSWFIFSLCSKEKLRLIYLVDHFSPLDTNGDNVISLEDFRKNSQKIIEQIENNDIDNLQKWAKQSDDDSIPDGWIKDHFSRDELFTYMKNLKMPIGIFHGTLDINCPVKGVAKLETECKKLKMHNVLFRYFEDYDHDLNLHLYYSEKTIPQSYKEIIDFIKIQCN
jgi:hypothetical protein